MLVILISSPPFNNCLNRYQYGSDRVSVLRADGTESGLTERAIELVNEVGILFLFIVLFLTYLSDISANI